MKLGIHINFVGALGTASILLWGLSQSEAKPEYSAPYIQIQTLPKPTQSVSIHLAPKPQGVRVEIIRRLAADITIKHLCKLRKYAALEPKEPGHQLASKENGDELGSQTEVKVTPLIRDIMNKVRPKQISGTITVEGKEYAFGSGGHGQSIPYGDYLITPDAVGSWGSRHGAIGVANGTIPDPKLHRDRDGIELHAATNDKLETDGCVSIKKDQWPQFKNQVLGMVKDNKKVYLHVSDQGASVSTTPLEFIGETISEPTFRDVLTTIENQPAKVESDRPAIRHHAKVRLRAESHGRLYGSCGHECRHRRAGDAGVRS